MGDGTMNQTSTSLALTMKAAAELVGVDYPTIKLGIDSGTIPTVQLGPRRMIPRAALLRIFGVEP
jgi:excisionase family DNA binding protein|tara:strand:+ start:53 stop:247 length:195 start_codon:yes stop_codon:yes gene_type:complete